MSAWLSRVFGRKHYYMACVALFTITSFFCGIAPSARGDADQSRPAGHRWRRPSASGTGDPGRHVSTRKTRIRIRALHRLPSSPRRPSAPSWAAGSPTTTTGAGSFSSTFPSDCSPFTSATAWCTTRLRSRIERKAARFGGRLKIDTTGICSDWSRFGCARDHFWTAARSMTGSAAAHRWASWHRNGVLGDRHLLGAAADDPNPRTAPAALSKLRHRLGLLLRLRLRPIRAPPR